jgi:propionate CoA-transferase
LTTESDIPAGEAIERLRYVNAVLGITPRRSSVDDALARLAAATFCENAGKDIYVNIGTGLPEEVCRILFEAGLLKHVTVFTESGVIGGIPAPGVFFGGAACPKEMVSSPKVFRLCYEKLDVTILGVLEADGEGNVNVSKRGEGPVNYVGPGGFIDITSAAKTVVFVTTWMHNARVGLLDGQIEIRKPGKPKFVEKVREITFCGKEALETGKKVFYVTTVGVFRLTHRGMELVRVMPGIDIQRDILGGSAMKVVLPESGQVPVVDPSVVHGRGFNLTFAAKNTI